jgi:hypothetical protein
VLHGPSGAEEVLQDFSIIFYASYDNGSEAFISKRETSSLENELPVLKYRTFSLGGETSAPGGNLLYLSENMAYLEKILLFDAGDKAPWLEQRSRSILCLFFFKTGKLFFLKSGG